MPSLDPKSLVSGLRRTLSARCVDYEGVIIEFGQVLASERRLQNKEFDFAAHVRGLILSLLSNQRPWGPIARNLDRIGDIFLHYDPQVIENTDPDQFTQRIRAIRCGNRQLAKQMAVLSRNIRVFRAIIEKYGSLDRF